MGGAGLEPAASCLQGRTPLLRLVAASCETAAKCPLSVLCTAPFLRRSAGACCPVAASKVAANVAPGGGVPPGVALPAHGSEHRYSSGQESLATRGPGGTSSQPRVLHEQGA